jgi:Fe-S-cluster containining protein
MFIIARTHLSVRRRSTHDDGVFIVSFIPLPYRIMALMQEQNRLFGFPIECLAGIIRECGFLCRCCGNCCTRCVNGHVFLLDHDVRLIRSIDPDAVEPAPGPEFCDDSGTFYVSGFALRSNGDTAGTCWFLENSRCRIYEHRPSACRIYPFMLRRKPDSEGTVDWRFCAQGGEHGEYHHALSWEVCFELALDILVHEHAVLTQEISFLEVMENYFSENRIQPDTTISHTLVRQYPDDRPVPVMVYYAETLEKHHFRGDPDSEFTLRTHPFHHCTPPAHDRCSNRQ